MKPQHPDFTVEQLRAHLTYDPLTGHFHALQKHIHLLPGRRIDVEATKGYRRVCVHSKKYRAHRLAWYYTHGEWPDEIDHINTDRADNRLDNLRPATRSLNKQNQRVAQKRNPTGFLGVSLVPTGGFTASIRVNKRTMHLGRFSTAEDAHQAYLAAKREHHEGCTI